MGFVAFLVTGTLSNMCFLTIFEGGSCFYDYNSIGNSINSLTISNPDLDPVISLVGDHYQFSFRRKKTRVMFFTSSQLLVHLNSDYIFTSKCIFLQQVLQKGLVYFTLEI